MVDIKQLALACGSTSAVLATVLGTAALALLREFCKRNSFDVLKRIMSLFLVRCATGVIVGCLIASAEYFLDSGEKGLALMYFILSAVYMGSILLLFWKIASIYYLPAQALNLFVQTHGRMAEDSAVQRIALK